MPSTFRDQKNLPEWVELDYYERPRGLRRWKRMLCWSALLVSMVGAGAVFFWPQAVQSGPVSPAHSMFNNNCAVCHQESFQTGKRLFSWDSSVRAVPDSACIQCHDGPAHHGKLETHHINCATCHREHRGRVKLAHVPDGQCTSCHADLKNHRVGGAEGLKFENVNGFPGNHPEMALWREERKDAGELHFNHHSHLKKEGVLKPDGKREKLDCVNCHRMDSAGRYMLPITYEQDCKGCHPLSVRLVGEYKQPNLQRAVLEFNKEPAPHGLQPFDVQAILRERLVQFVQRHPLRRVEGGSLTDRAIPRSRPPEITEQQWEQVESQLSKLNDKLFFSNKHLDRNNQVLFENAGGCRFCHVSEEKRDPRGLPVYKETKMETRWFKHSRFNHQSHRMLNCTECHEATTSKLTRDVLMPKMQNCKECHNPKQGVRHDCVECHGYHDRSQKHEIHKQFKIKEAIDP